MQRQQNDEATLCEAGAKFEVEQTPPLSVVVCDLVFEAAGIQDRDVWAAGLDRAWESMEPEPLSLTSWPTNCRRVWGVFDAPPSLYQRQRVSASWSTAAAD